MSSFLYLFSLFFQRWQIVAPAGTTYLLLGFNFTLLVAGCLAIRLQPPKTAESERHDVLFTFACGPQCNCNSVNTQLGNCACKLAPNAPTKCGCGKPGFHFSMSFQKHIARRQ